MTFRQQFIRARGTRTQAEAARAISPLLSVRTVQDWELGRRQPPRWVQSLILDRLRGH